MRLEEWPDGELRFWAHQLDPDDKTTRELLAQRGLEIDVKEMTSEYVLRFCGFGYGNGLKYVDMRPGSSVFEAVVAVGFDFFRGVEHPQYGDTRWRVTLRRIDDQRLHIAGKLIGWRGMLMLGRIKAEADMERVAQPPDACTPSPVYPVRRRMLTDAAPPRGSAGSPPRMRSGDETDSGSARSIAMNRALPRATRRVAAREVAVEPQRRRTTEP